MQDSTYDWTKLGEQVKYIKGIGINYRVLVPKKKPNQN